MFRVFAFSDVRIILWIQLESLHPLPSRFRMTHTFVFGLTHLQSKSFRYRKRCPSFQLRCDSMSGDIFAAILITIFLTSALLVITLRSWRGHRIYLLSTALGLSVLSFAPGNTISTSHLSISWDHPQYIQWSSDRSTSVNDGLFGFAMSDSTSDF